ncbi:MAG TPA: hypothetical protein DEP05_03630 [Betaproteobacteria bacterium]|nr:hypothetical protein [Betaproteobacteria bacterium]
MFKKYFNLFKSGKRSGKESRPSGAEGKSAYLLTDVVPPVNTPGRPIAPEAPVIDTGNIPVENVVTSILDIPTDGETTDMVGLRQRFIGRQPVFDRFQKIIGYELMLRGNTDTDGYSRRKWDESLQRLYDETLLKCILGLRIERLLGDRQIFIPLTPAALGSPLLSKLPRNGIVVVVPVMAERVESLFKPLQQLAAAGFQLALDDFVYSPEMAPLLKIAHYVRIHVGRFDAIELGKQVVALMKGAEPRMLAIGVNAEEDFEVCRKLSFHYFQGLFFSRPKLVSVQRIGNDRLQVMELLNKVKIQAELPELEEGFKRNPMLSYKLLRYINSAANGFEQEIRSIGHALIVLGYEQLYRWLTLLLFTSGHADQRSRSILKNALVRARLTELLGQRELAPPASDSLFIVGIFSLLDVLLDMPINKALANLHLPQPIFDALVKGHGVYAPFLKLAVACEDENPQKIEKLAEMCGVDADVVNDAHLQALLWAEQIEVVSS